MSTLSVRLPDSLHRAVGDLSKKDRVSMNQFITTAVAEKVATLKAIDWLEERAKRGSRKAFEAVLAKVPDVPPEPGDELPAKTRKRPTRPARTR